MNIIITLPFVVLASRNICSDFLAFLALEHAVNKWIYVFLSGVISKCYADFQLNSSIYKE